MVTGEDDWLSLTEASELLGVHATTLRRWADAGEIPHLRTPGGHRRFTLADLAGWVQREHVSTAPAQSPNFVHSALGFTRQEMATSQVSNQGWYLAFDSEEERRHMRDSGRRLLGLALQFASRTSKPEPLLQEGRRIGEFFGQQCAMRRIPVADTVRALFFFRASLLRATQPGQTQPGQFDAEDVRRHGQLIHFMDEVTYACLAGYEATSLSART